MNRRNLFKLFGGAAAAAALPVAALAASEYKVRVVDTTRWMKDEPQFIRFVDEDGTIRHVLLWS